MLEMFDDFETAQVETGETRIYIRRGGAGPPILLLHGFPQTHLMWRRVAPLLARRFTVVCADLRGYGHSGRPPSTPDHEPYSKRAMAKDMIAAMDRLGFQRFSVAGHDRGGRVAYRLALDHPERVECLAVLDIVPTQVAWEMADARFATGFWPWSLLAQPEPLPERLLAGAPEAVIDDALAGWGTPASVFEADARDAYVEALRDPESIHAVCEEYRAAATLDREHDEEDRRAGRRIACPVLAMWSDRGPLAEWYSEAGGPLGIWRAWADDVRGTAVAAGHFFAEESPEETAAVLNDFLREFRAS
jgi:haloacetate dehalogenase